MALVISILNPAGQSGIPTQPAFTVLFLSTIFPLRHSPWFLLLLIINVIKNQPRRFLAIQYRWENPLPVRPELTPGPPRVSWRWGTEGATCLLSCQIFFLKKYFLLFKKCVNIPIKICISSHICLCCYHSSYYIIKEILRCFAAFICLSILLPKIIYILCNIQRPPCRWLHIILFHKYDNIFRITPIRCWAVTLLQFLLTTGTNPWGFIFEIRAAFGSGIRHTTTQQFILLSGLAD